MAIEEHDGYMNHLLEDTPELTERINALRNEHAEYRVAWAEIITKLERLEPTDQVGLAAIRQDVIDLWRLYADHDRRETALIQECLLTDCGPAD